MSLNQPKITFNYLMAIQLKELSDEDIALFNKQIQ